MTHNKEAFGRGYLVMFLNQRYVLTSNVKPIGNENYSVDAIFHNEIDKINPFVKSFEYYYDKTDGKFIEAHSGFEIIPIGYGNLETLHIFRFKELLK